MAKGYTPRVQGTNQVRLPEGIKQAQEELSARRLLARVLKSRPTPTRDDVHEGQDILILVPGDLVVVVNGRSLRFVRSGMMALLKLAGVGNPV